MNILPRYTFRTTGAACPRHNDPDCLCDVHIDKPAPILTHIPHMFHDLALEELDDYGVNNRNVVEFFSIVLGCHDTFRREVRDADEDGNWLRTNVPPEGKDDVGPPAWRALPAPIRAIMRRHYNAGTPWSYAILELENLGLSDEDVVQVRHFYNVGRRNVYHTDKRRVGVTLRDCHVCGTPFVARQINSLFCSTKCRVKQHRRNKKQEAQG